ncbi:efflux RND transporter permease subunit [Aquimarina rhabdastrellae]
MLNKSIRFLIENKLIAIVIAILILVWGIIHAPFDWNKGILPNNPVAVDAIPDIGENQQIVFTKWDGRSPQDIEDQITYPLTTALMGISGVKTIRSSSMFGFSSIYVIFEEDVEFYWSRSRIIEKLNSLPTGLLPQGVSPAIGPDATGLGQIFWYTLEGRDKQGNVTGGWNLEELRSIQDYDVKYALATASGVSEVASIGGYVKEYQIDVDPEKMRQYGIALGTLVKAIKESNKDTGAQTLEINKAEYYVRGLGYIQSIADIENTVIESKEFTPIKVKDIAKVTLGPATRRGILDKEGAEVAGGVIIARYGANPLEVINNVKKEIAKIAGGLPSKELKDGSISQVTIVPFYDRTQLIKETLGTLKEALTLEVLITILVIVFMVYNLRASILISGVLPIAILMVFIAMKLLHIDANIVALSGIAIAIGTMVDVGVILCENIIKHLQERKEEVPINTIVYEATTEVSGAIITAVLTTIISFIPVFVLTGAEGKLFTPLAYTKTFALIASVIVTLFLIPPFAAVIFKKRSIKGRLNNSIQIVILLIGVFAISKGYYLGIVLIGLSGINLIKNLQKITAVQANRGIVMITVITIIVTLAIYWKPLGAGVNMIWNVLFVSVLCLGLLGGFLGFKHYYSRILRWALQYKLLFLSVPATLIVLGIMIWKQTGKEFMPALDEGSFLLMPTSLPHAGIAENKRVLQQLDMAVATIPEIETVVGKAGRINSALDPAPLSMYENIINYKSEYMLNEEGEQQRFKIDDQGNFILKNGNTLKPIAQATSYEAYKDIKMTDLIKDDQGAYFRQWRSDIKTPNDIWNEIVKRTKLPGITSAPKLQPIQTRLVMLQTGMRAPMGIKIKGRSLKEIETFGLALETYLKQVDGVKKEAVFADRIIGKPYVLIDIDREKSARYGLSIQQIQDVIDIAVGGKMLTQTVEGRERYGVRVRYPRELRAHPEDLALIYVPLSNGTSIPLSEVVTISYEQGPQMIKSEDAFLVGYVLFDKQEGYAEVDVVENAVAFLKQKIEADELVIPNGINYQFTGTYENQVRAEKTLSFVVPLVLVIIFLILYMQFRSVLTALLIFVGIAVAFAGGFIMIGLYNQEWFMDVTIGSVNLRELFQIQNLNLSVAVWVGFIALFGIATDDGVVMGTYLKQNFDKNKPQTIQEIRAAVLEAGERRIRPCLMTTATTILALIPILTSTGRGSDIMIPMAIPSFGGMLVALITLFVVPVLFSWKEEIQIKRKN